ncbi:MAG: Uncharacterized protein G01um10145_609 [Microgenomates group bacterium Gr01-1014_5]|nr:MAG: Uncharacterized protein G01um10145_609 [Microgenomates group bacterium Gr01-1014_5]
METNSVLKNWSLAFLCLALIGVGTFSYLVSGTDKLSVNKLNVQALSEEKTTILTLNPANITVKKGVETFVTINIDTNEDSVSAVEAVLSYNPKFIEVTDITPGLFFEKANVLEQTINQKKGNVTFVLGGIRAKQGKGTVAKIKIKGLQKGRSNLSLEGSQAAAVQKSFNVLKETTAGYIIVD